MKFKQPENLNYCATVVEIKNIVPLPNCDNIQATHIFGNQVIISKNTKIGDVGVYFPAETKLLDNFLKMNNLFRNKELNNNQEETGYMENNGRVRTMKFRQNESCGLFLPTTCLTYLLNEKINELKVGDTFDYINNEQICKKYKRPTQERSLSGTKKQKRIKVSKCIEGQFRFHKDTEQLGNNISKLELDDLISITYKLHGTSVVISKVLCKKKLNPIEKILKFCGVKIIDTYYDNLYSSRTVIKNDDMDKITQHYYKEDIWGLANDQLKEYLMDGMTLYAEIVGSLPSGGSIQKGYDYGCQPNKYKVFIYRITYTTPTGDVFEFSAKQVNDWCLSRGLNPVPLLFYDRVYKLFDDQYEIYKDVKFRSKLLAIIKEKYLEKSCYICKNKVPEEGIVLRIEGENLQAFKCKSFRFLERETKQLDTGEVDIEEEQVEDQIEE